MCQEKSERTNFFCFLHLHYATSELGSMSGWQENPETMNKLRARWSCKTNDSQKASVSLMLNWVEITQKQKTTFGKLLTQDSSSFLFCFHNSGLLYTYTLELSFSTLWVYLGFIWKCLCPSTEILISLILMNPRHWYFWKHRPPNPHPGWYQ